MPGPVPEEPQAGPARTPPPERALPPRPGGAASDVPFDNKPGSAARTPLGTDRLPAERSAQALWRRVALLAHLLPVDPRAAPMILRLSRDLESLHAGGGGRPGAGGVVIWVTPAGPPWAGAGADPARAGTL
jgi:hypothetical protein